MVPVCVKVTALLNAVAKSTGIAGPVVEVLESATEELITSVSSSSVNVTDPLSASVGVEASSVTAPVTFTTVIVGASLVPAIVMVTVSVSASFCESVAVIVYIKTSDSPTAR